MISLPKDRFKNLEHGTLHKIELDYIPKFSLEELKKIAEKYWSVRNGRFDYSTTFCTCPIKEIRWKKPGQSGHIQKVAKDMIVGVHKSSRYFASKGTNEKKYYCRHCCVTREKVEGILKLFAKQRIMLAEDRETLIASMSERISFSTRTSPRYPILQRIVTHHKSSYSFANWGKGAIRILRAIICACFGIPLSVLEMARVLSFLFGEKVEMAIEGHLTTGKRVYPKKRKELAAQGHKFGIMALVADTWRTCRHISEQRTKSALAAAKRSKQ